MLGLRTQEHKTLSGLLGLKRKASISQIVRATGLSESTVRRSLLVLESNNLIIIDEKKHTITKLTNEGKLWAERGLPERQALIVLLEKNNRELRISDISIELGIKADLIPIILGWLIRKKWAIVNKEKNSIITTLTENPAKGLDEVFLDLLKKKGEIVVEDHFKFNATIQLLKKRQLLEMRTKKIRTIQITKKGKITAGKSRESIKVITQLTPKLLQSGKWEEMKFQKYDLTAPVASNWPGKRHPYMRFIREVREKLVALGFKEMSGPTVETSFFNFDALFTPQDHPAREIFGIYRVKKPEFGNLDIYKETISKVKLTHENGWLTGSKGWEYKYSRKKAKRLILRGHGTCLSARTLLSKDLRIPSKYFSIVRCYRPEVLDRTHLSEFNQVEGIVVDERLTLRDLLGVLKKFAIEIAGADKVLFKPDYFPFTEPSVELSAYKQDYGWIEFGGSGIFRPEVTLPLGIQVPVIAWGLGIDRLFMMKAGIEDIRSIFSQDLDWLRRKEVV